MVSVAFFVVFFRARCRLLPEVPPPASIPATLADRLDDTKVAEDIATHTPLTYMPMKKEHQSYESWAGSRPVSRRVVYSHLGLR